MSDRAAPPPLSQNHPDQQSLWRRIAAQFTAARVTAAFTVILALATLALVITAIVQHGDAVQAIEAIKQQVTASREANYYGQRASIILHETQLLFGPNGFLFVPEWQNTGNTDAVEVSSHVSYHFSRDPLPAGFTLVTPKNILTLREVETPVFTLGPKETTDSTEWIFPKNCILDLMAHEYRFAYVWGVTKYLDVFSSKGRTTRFCWRVFGEHGTGIVHHFLYQLCDEGNCTDERCDEFEKQKPPSLPPPETCHPIAVKSQPVSPAGTPTSPTPPAQPTPTPSPPAQPNK